MVDLLMTSGSNPNIIPTDKVEQTTMIHAAYSGNLLMFKILLNIDNKYKYGFDWVCYI